MKLTKDTLLLKGPHPLKNEYKLSLQLTDVQRHIIVGTLLGAEGRLEQRGAKPAYRYYFSQKESQQTYVNHIYSHFIDWCSKEPQIAKSGTNSENIPTKFAYFRTCTHPAFEFYANQFYKIESRDNNRVKVIPTLLHKWLSPQALAYWFMDDGCKDKYGYVLNTQCYSLAEQHILADALGRTFKFEVNVHKDRKSYRLYITNKSCESFARTVKPFILPSFEYKLF